MAPTIVIIALLIALTRCWRVLAYPYFSGGQQARIKSARINWQIAADNYEAGLQAFKNSYAVAQERYRSAKELVAAFERRYLKNAELISETANKQLAAGTINYLEWVQVTNQAVGIRNEYADAVKNLNETLIQLNYLNSKIRIVL